MKKEVNATEKRLLAALEGAGGRLIEGDREASNTASRQPDVTEHHATSLLEGEEETKGGEQVNQALTRECAIKLKVADGQADTRRIIVSRASTLDNLQSAIEGRYGRPAASIQWADEEGDVINIKTDDDLRDAIRRVETRTMTISLG